jgi:hypothetical protein
MLSDSHKAQRNSFARHRAILLFARPNVETAEPRKTGTPKLEKLRLAHPRNWTVADGIHGFTPSTAAFA